MFNRTAAIVSLRR